MVYTFITTFTYYLMYSTDLRVRVSFAGLPTWLRMRSGSEDISTRRLKIKESLLKRVWRVFIGWFWSYRNIWRPSWAEVRFVKKKLCWWQCKKDFVELSTSWSRSLSLDISASVSRPSSLSLDLSTSIYWHWPFDLNFPTLNISISTS